MKQKAGFKFFLSALFLAVFIALIVILKTVDLSRAGSADTVIGLSRLNTSVRDAIGTSDFFYQIAKALGLLALAVGAAFACFGLWQWIRRKSLVKVDRVLFALGGTYLLLGAFYLLFEKVVVNYRPVLEEGASFPEASFPSSHTMLGIVLFGTAAIECFDYIKKKPLRLTLQGVFISLAALTVLSRLLSGVHWLTDICGGIFLGAALLFAFSAVRDLCVRKKS